MWSIFYHLKLYIMMGLPVEFSVHNLLIMELRILCSVKYSDEKEGKWSSYISSLRSEAKALGQKRKNVQYSHVVYHEIPSRPTDPPSLQSQPSGFHFWWGSTSQECEIARHNCEGLLYRLNPIFGGLHFHSSPERLHVYWRYVFNVKI